MLFHSLTVFNHYIYKAISSPPTVMRRNVGARDTGFLLLFVVFPICSAIVSFFPRFLSTRFLITAISYYRGGRCNRGLERALQCTGKFQKQGRHALWSPVHTGGEIHTVFDEEFDFQVKNSQFRLLGSKHLERKNLA